MSRPSALAAQPNAKTSNVKRSNIKTSNVKTSNAKPNSGKNASGSCAIPISLAYAPTPTRQLYVELQVAPGTQLMQALAEAGWLTAYPDLNQWCQQQQAATEIQRKDWRVGVFADKKLLSYVLQAHDRVEVYRPLLIPPMSKRKIRALQH